MELSYICRADLISSGREMATVVIEEEAAPQGVSYVTTRWEGEVVRRCLVLFVGP